jgi:uncharacterized membrane protein YqaE (UPF0057 family)
LLTAVIAPLLVLGLRLGAHNMIFIVNVLLRIAGIGYLVALCHALGEVHQFSSWKGLGAVMIPHMMVGVPLLVLALFVHVTIPHCTRVRARDIAVMINLQSINTAMESYRGMEGAYTTLDKRAAQDVLPVPGGSISGRGADAVLIADDDVYRLGGAPSREACCPEALPENLAMTRTCSINQDGDMYVYDDGAWL